MANEGGVMSIAHSTNLQLQQPPYRRKALTGQPCGNRQQRLERRTNAVKSWTATVPSYIYCGCICQTTQGNIASLFGSKGSLKRKAALAHTGWEPAKERGQYERMGIILSGLHMVDEKRSDAVIYALLFA